jgi:hypothetical protein
MGEVLAAAPSLNQLVNGVEPVGDGSTPTLRLAQIAEAALERIGKCFPLAGSMASDLFGAFCEAMPFWKEC